MIEAAQRYLLRSKPATDLKVLLQHQHLLSSFAQVRSHAEPIGAASYDDEVILCHLPFLQCYFSLAKP